MSSEDIEKKDVSATFVAEDSSSGNDFASAEKHGILGKLRYYESLLDKKLGVEAEGPARMLPEERDPAYNKWQNQAIMALMWASGTMNLSCFTSGILGWELGLDLKQTILISIFGTLIGAAVTVCSFILTPVWAYCYPKS